jgi:hypothetical protein
MFNRFVIQGNIIRITETHYVTSLNGGVSSWSKRYYRLPSVQS